MNLKRIRIQAVRARLRRLYALVREAERTRSRSHAKIRRHRKRSRIPKKIATPFTHGAVRLESDASARLMALRERITAEERALSDLMRAPEEDASIEFLRVDALAAIDEARTRIQKRLTFSDVAGKTENKVLGAISEMAIPSRDESIDRALARVHDTVFAYGAMTGKDFRLAPLARYENIMLLYATAEMRDVAALERDLARADHLLARLQETI